MDKADFIILTCALTPATKHIINRETINLVKDGVHIVNVSRGPLIDEAALSDALLSGKVASAALEVFETEPFLPVARFASSSSAFLEHTMAQIPSKLFDGHQ